jgi:hypothetical protein
MDGFESVSVRHKGANAPLVSSKQQSHTSRDAPIFSDSTRFERAAYDCPSGGAGNKHLIFFVGPLSLHAKPAVATASF